MKEEQLRLLPKVELHCHLDGSLSRSFMEETLQRKVKDEEIYVSDNCANLTEYLEKFALPCKCLNSIQRIKKATLDVLFTMHQENVIYAEIRFSPLLLVNGTMDLDDVIQAVIDGLKEGEKLYGVSSGLIICLMRHHSFEENKKVLETAEKYLGKGVCAVDLAGAESAYPMSEFMDVFHIANQKGFPITIHAGECGSLQNVLDAIDVGALRIGHGIALQGHTKAQAILKKRGIGVEMCPTSNLQTKAVIDPLTYPISEFIQNGILVSVNTDNRTVSHTSLTKEFLWLQNHCNISDDEILTLIKNAARTSFLSQTEKQGLLKQIRQSEE